MKQDSSIKRMLSLKRDFLLCGSAGWCLEVFWTGLHAFLAGEPTMMGRTSLLMFPIYGCAAVIKPVYAKLSAVPAAVRGCIYTVGIYAAEFSTGSFLRRFHMCPWDYSCSPFHYKGLIRLDYAPVWFAAGLLFERLLIRNPEKIPYGAGNGWKLPLSGKNPSKSS